MELQAAGLVEDGQEEQLEQLQTVLNQHSLNQQIVRITEIKVEIYHQGFIKARIHQAAAVEQEEQEEIQVLQL
jgi:hypothetical protein